MHTCYQVVIAETVVHIECLIAVILIVQRVVVVARLVKHSRKSFYIPILVVILNYPINVGI